MKLRFVVDVTTLGYSIVSVDIAIVLEDQDDVEEETPSGDLGPVG